ncbi:MAG TPA: hypothetical protein VHE35_27410, partial [Kofleriaceae bacterium]|nr:hypothetical protein [Kofleriaceae bacterium]
VALAVAVAAAAVAVAIRARRRSSPAAPGAPPASLRHLRLVADDACLTAVPFGAVTTIALAPCDRAHPRADQTWLLEDAALGSRVRDLPAGAGPAMHLRTLDGRCLDGRGFLSRCDDAGTRIAVSRRFVGVLWTVEADVDGATRCLRHTGTSSADWLTGDACDAGGPPLRWELEDVVPLDQTTTITIGGRCLGLRGDDDSPIDGAPAELRDCAAGPQLDERWQIVPVDEHGRQTRYVQLHNAYKGGCLEVGEVDLHGPGATVDTYMCSSGMPDRDAYWIPIELGPSQRRLQNRVSGLYLTVGDAASKFPVVVDPLIDDPARQVLSAPAAFWRPPPSDAR